MRNIAVITARSGSKALKDKNIKPLNGVPLLAYSIFAAQKSGVFETIMVSTDSTEYAKISREFGAEVPFLRSEQTSGDSAGSWDVIKEVLRNYGKAGVFFDSVCLLQPTSPLREACDIVNGYDELIQKNADAITAVCEMEHSPLWSMRLPEDKSLREYRKNSVDLPRQKIERYYRVNGALYIRKIEYMDSEIILKNDNEYAYIMDQKRSVDIDNLEDFEYAEYLITKRG